MKKKLLVVSLCAIIAIMAIAGSSLAWLKDETKPVVNTFTEGKVDIDLYEHGYDATNNTLTNTEIRDNGNTYKMVPGNDLPKDPTVVVKAGSEPCYVFVEVVEHNAVDTFLTYSIDTGVWKVLDATNYPNVYYMEITTVTSDDTSYNVLAGQKVTVNNTVEMSHMVALTENTRPQLKFTAYAVQKANVANATTAWNIVKPAVTPDP